MNILSIETSCDETAISLVQATGDFPEATYTVLGNALFSQIDIHREFGGVFPNVAKREHVKTVIPMLEKALREAEMLQDRAERLPNETFAHLTDMLSHEEGLAEALTAFFQKYEIKGIDLIAVTNGPGLEPALWVGVNFARALASLLHVPVIPTNHMEGHILSSVFDGERLAPLSFPAVSLLISGGHTQLVVSEDWQNYRLLGETRDDAVGEAFDKVARMMGLPYPGGPEISRLAKIGREKDLPEYTELPRPMLHSGDLDFSFSGLKTAVRYAIQDTELDEDQKAALARDFEDVVTEVLLAKTRSAVEEIGAQSLILGGGVTANIHIRASFEKMFGDEVNLYLPNRTLSTDNAIMIALAGHAHANNPENLDSLAADGNRSICA
ncbi:tRNA (adenosine(37)-N6)-threonylcarbamoyltransferase complex transferase subunit TsaD [Candidatus Kaiserbacteria bacterium]|nr:tRNA (adenosine(37)-N6)-threonylcarbamoyltransferase complex transferase subunit TsaD [Candidatus Kaiserbacteria bacterium]